MRTVGTQIAQDRCIQSVIDYIELSLHQTIELVAGNTLVLRPLRHFGFPAAPFPLLLMSLFLAPVTPHMPAAAVRALMLAAQVQQLALVPAFEVLQPVPAPAARALAPQPPALLVRPLLLFVVACVVRILAAQLEFGAHPFVEVSRKRMVTLSRA